MDTTHEMQIAGHKLAALCFDAGVSGPPIILLHGITSSIKSWIPDELSLFTQHGPCYALSLPGHYPAVLPPGFQQESLTAEMIADVLVVAIRQLVGEQPVTLVGHSTGGFSALAIAARVPDIAHRIISISGFAQGQWTGLLGTGQRLVQRGFLGVLLFKTVYRSNRWPPALFRASLRIYVANSRKFLAYPYLDKMIDLSLPYYRKLDLNAMVQYFARMPRIDITPWLSRITAPTLILTGDSDPIVPPAQAHLIAAKVPDASLQVIKGVGHLPMFEAPNRYKQLIGEWLATTAR